MAAVVEAVVALDEETGGGACGVPRRALAALTRGPVRDRGDGRGRHRRGHDADAEDSDDSDMAPRFLYAEPADRRAGIPSEPNVVEAGVSGPGDRRRRIPRVARRGSSTASGEAQMRILVTGGAGYVGSVSVEKFLDAGHDVTVLDDLSTGHRGAVAAGRALEVGSYGDTAAVVALLRAAPDRRRPALRRQVARRRVDGGSGQVLPRERGRRHRPARRRCGPPASGASSSAPPPPPTACPSGRRSSSPIPSGRSTPTARPSAASRRRSRWYGHGYGLRSVILRYFNVAGASKTHGEAARARDAPHPERPGRRGGRAARSRSSATTTRLPTARASATTSTSRTSPRRTCWRSWRRIPADPADRPGGGPCEPLICNLGSGTGFSNRQIVAAAETVVGHADPGQDRPAPRRRSAGARGQLGPRAGACSAGGRATARIEEIIGSAWEWRRAHPAGYAGLGHGRGLRIEPCRCFRRKRPPEPPPDARRLAAAAFRRQRRHATPGTPSSSRAGAACASWPGSTRRRDALHRRDGVDCTDEFADRRRRDRRRGAGRRLDPRRLPDRRADAAHRQASPLAEIAAPTRAQMMADPGRPAAAPPNCRRRSASSTRTGRSPSSPWTCSEIDGSRLLDLPLLERKRLLDGALEPSELVRITPFVRPPIGTLPRHLARPRLPRRSPTRAPTAATPRTAGTTTGPIVPDAR